MKSFQLIILLLIVLVLMDGGCVSANSYDNDRTWNDPRLQEQVDDNDAHQADWLWDLLGNVISVFPR